MLGTAPSLSPSCCSLDEGAKRRNPGTFAMTWIALHPGYKLTESYLWDTILLINAKIMSYLAYCHADGSSGRSCASLRSRHSCILHSRADPSKPNDFVGFAATAA